VQIEIDFNDITQFSSNHSIAVTEQDGNAEGTLESFAINEVGEIVGAFTNGTSDILGKVGMATFNNPQGLMETGNSMYVQSSNSGLAQIGVAGVGGRGTLIPGALEMSNVDLAEEFTNMIVAQRGFQATSRIITTSDQILQELVNIKR
jgi:flagellar hook protein FlgE